MAHALVKMSPGLGDEERYQYKGKVIRDLNTPHRIEIELDDGTVYQIGLASNAASDKVGLQVRLIETNNLSVKLAVVPEASNALLLYPAPEDF
jgi:hypothetical protein